MTITAHDYDIRTDIRCVLKQHFGNVATPTWQPVDGYLEILSGELCCYVISRIGALHILVRI